jgi:hypothetical protein
MGSVDAANTPTANTAARAMITTLNMVLIEAPCDTSGRSYHKVLGWMGETVTHALFNSCRKGENPFVISVPVLAIRLPYASLAV